MPGKIGRGCWCLCILMPVPYTHTHERSLCAWVCACTARLQECLWCVRPLPCLAWGSVLEPKCVRLCGLSMADANTPPAWPCVTPVNVRESSISGCVRQGAHKCTCRWEAQFWNSLSAQGTPNHQPVKRYLDHWSERPCSHPAPAPSQVDVGVRTGVPTFLILCSWPWRPLSGQQLGVVYVGVGGKGPCTPTP